MNDDFFTNILQPAINDGKYFILFATSGTKIYSTSISDVTLDIANGYMRYIEKSTGLLCYYSLSDIVGIAFKTDNMKLPDYLLI